MQKTTLFLLLFWISLTVALAQINTVGSRQPIEEKEVSDADFSVNKINALRHFFPHLTGAGLLVSIKENPFDTSDVDFRGRILLRSTLNNRFTDHATIIASLIGSGGNSGGNSLGIAPKVTLTTSDFSRFLPDEPTSLAGVSVQNHSYGVGSETGLTVENFYGNEAVEYDKQTHQIPELLHVFSSGNAGNQANSSGLYANLTGFANLTGQFKLSKNTLSVGAISLDGQVAPLSSKGPAFDGRIKPEIMAFGSGGTSEAAALVSGTALLMQQLYKNNTAKLPPAALIKAALINSADDVGLPGIDFEAGFGSLDALGAVRTLSENRFFLGSVKPGETQKFQITVPAGVPLLKITLVWHDKEASKDAPKALINDLDMELISLNSKDKWLPWSLSTFPNADSLRLPARREIDHINNVEQITLELPQAGTYEIRISGFSVLDSSQDFAVVFEEETGFEWLTPMRGNSLKPNEITKLRWNFNEILPQNARLEYKFVSTSNWQKITDDVSLKAGNFVWKVPDSSGLFQLRCIYDNKIFESDTFVVSNPVSVKVGFICENQLMLYWNPVASAETYNVLRLGTQSMEIWQKTTDTILVLDIKQANANRFTVQPIISGFSSNAAISLDYRYQNITCYFRNFLAEKAVSDTIWLSLEIGTYYKVHKIILEKLTNGIFVSQQQIENPRQFNFRFRDPNPNIGINTYRIQLITDSGARLFSEDQYVFYLSESDIVFFPNPIVSGENLNIAVSDETVTVEIFDLQGRSVWQSTEIGLIKNINTKNLKQGIYLVRVSGRLVGKLVVL